ncbi:helix-turn-helix domain-containing protein [Agrobacterium tumefaciens]|uniref:helix-turn-helix domain-containing protein n=1 Tax=Agrobacterium tumefaciens TaxID=358 RepID=UPI000EF1ABE5|nr:helix-turn-helix transcriptional regulator [Agrobacterium tumefaciens]NSZ31199.1 helix-turn-helix transcriptional regulator [Agrobacterium tumefaciens]QLG20892.1 helix-turn-helix transcriptional regulator [Agrobacterium tumefaciens]UXS84786.1 helix-turn-helix transcriptional regulator [Agrobacterium tumefaciens]
MAKTLHSERQKMLVTAIAEQRRAKGLSQAQVAKALGRHQPFIANIESGERRVDLLELLALADIIELDVHALIDRLQLTTG